MTKPPKNILDRIGNTPLLELRKIAPTNGARILLKLESENPTGSMKDRMALAMIEAARAGLAVAKGPNAAVFSDLFLSRYGAFKETTVCQLGGDVAGKG